jgi:hypothetical protein
MKNKIKLSAYVYRNTKNDFLISVPVPNSSGYNTQIQNVVSS